MTVLQMPEGAAEKEYDVGCSLLELSAKQASGKLGSLAVQDAEDSDCYAMEDRLGMKSNGELELYERSLFVVIDVESSSALIFDDKGIVINEPEHGIHAGKQLLSEFTRDWTAEFYRIAVFVPETEIGGGGGDDLLGSLYSDGRVEEGTRLRMKFDTGLW